MNKTNIRSHIFYNLLYFIYDKVITWNGYKNAIELFIKRLPLKNKSYLILDVGCGTGLVSYSIAKINKNAKIIGYDLSEKMVRIAQNYKNKYENVNFYIGNAENMDFLYTLNNKKVSIKKNSFDMIFSAGSLEYTNLQKTYKHLASFIKKGGYFYNIAVKKNLYGIIIGKIMGFVPYSEKEIIHAMQNAGLEKIHRINFNKKESVAGRFKIMYAGKKK